MASARRVAPNDKYAEPPGNPDVPRPQPMGRRSSAASGAVRRPTAAEGHELWIDCLKSVDAHVRCVTLVGTSTVWAGEWDGSITVRAVRGANVLGYIPLQRLAHSHHLAEEYVWSLLQVGRQLWPCTAIAL